MRVIAVVQARLGSQRYPRKVLELIGSKPMIAHVAERAVAIRGVDFVSVAFPASDRKLLGRALRDEPLAAPHPSPAAESDVLARFAIVAGLLEADAVMRLTADCPLLAPDLAEAVLALYRCHPTYAEVPDLYYTDGFDVEVFSNELLQRAHREATNPDDRQHVTPWIQRECGLYYTGPRHSKRKLSVDTPDDLERVRRIMTHVKGLNFADTFAAAVEAGL